MNLHSGETTPALDDHLVFAAHSRFQERGRLRETAGVPGVSEDAVFRWVIAVCVRGLS